MGQNQWHGTMFLGMIQGWPDLILGLVAPVAAICQTQSASADSGSILP